MVNDATGDFADLGDLPQDYDISLEDTGLKLNLGGLGDEPTDEEAKPRPVTEHDIAELRRVEAELLKRWGETEIDPTLDRVRLVMDYLGEPQTSFRSIHVAGTNGKTSTTRMIESLLRAFGHRVGRTTSPHLQLITERIGIDGAPIHPAQFVAIYDQVAPYVELADQHSGQRLSYFEALICLAYAAFADAPVEVAVVEVGMGGRWDATNVIEADVNVIMPIGLDHTDYLGETLTEIAGEKAGIITNPDSVTIIADQEPEAMRVVLEAAVETGSAVARLGSEFTVAEATVAVGGQNLTLKGLGGEYTNIFLPLSGPHQARNAAVALAAVEAFHGASSERPLDADTVRRGFASVESPGRLERVRATPTTFIDATHNPHGARALADALANDFDFTRLIGVLGVLGDKDATGILAALEPVFTEVVITQNTSPRAMDAYELAELAREIYGDERVHVVTRLADAYELAVELAEDALAEVGVQSGSGVVITGSVVTAGEARTMFGKEP
ncbi:bifunctional tetrahydrofolate synthase/dihydrofolate synthase [Corynebacterium sanguinis]|uniref:Dihydrofolate synthase/folylpolyglutamate synthase n=1 Tax=Corynebacterium sanguinis TaxID=2594913 RepID=A0A6C1TUE2_9CORY|nr:folylpolyglutamate synthase/dihydrofolate synthase family protein [Corynebacterium sanguinis]MCT1597265.1 bifunctional folylpolyglutamate synthase/dihydrofolate synthase [Corynebacterium sanguinis]MCT1628821.1 bifunctional folylpolyglutamate synthase/dihydrofolate synthase [Corynebacterium sanguinis]TVS21616.1 bifunctional folylpolyglutamate synthase/dihydrofolate synthase [Corynebacterium sanguinis]TVS26204.1 bifunctional folylpolyglutamate synthase/dihydrofolate synthase [Corynebacterium s